MLDRLDEQAREITRVIDIAGNAGSIYDAFSDEFSEKIGLAKLDWGFLFTATALQMLRQYFLTSFPERLGDQAAAEKVEGKDRIRRDKNYRRNNLRAQEYYNPSVPEIIAHSVPFDANVGSNGVLKGAGSLGHRGATPGHDPIVGLVVGTANIATATLTNWVFDSWHIKPGARKNGGMQEVSDDSANTIEVFGRNYDKMFNEGIDGKKKVAAALAKEVLHLRTDINSKKGLPLPIIGTLSPRTAFFLAEYGLDFGNVLNVGEQAMLAKMINILTAMLHGIFYDQKRDGCMELYKVRTKKILIYSNAIAASTKALAVWFTGQTR